ncbi:hypothetical protein DICA4_D09208 [Diutina catenulata]
MGFLHRISRGTGLVTVRVVQLTLISGIRCRLCTQLVFCGPTWVLSGNLQRSKCHMPGGSTMRTRSSVSSSPVSARIKPQVSSSPSAPQMPHMEIPEYVKLLAEAPAEDYSSERYLEEERSRNLPTVAEVVSHLKILRAFAQLKASIIGVEGDEASIKRWQIFVTRAVHRFILWITALRNYLRPDRTIARFYSPTMRPPFSPDSSVKEDFPSLGAQRSRGPTPPHHERAESVPGSPLVGFANLFSSSGGSASSTVTSASSSSSPVQQKKRPINRNRSPSSPLIPTVTREQQLYKIGTMKNINFYKVFDSHLPPLDVIMVWHAFLLMPRSVYDTFMRQGFMFFANYPFPLKLIAECISDHSYTFDPPEYYRVKYFDILERVLGPSTTSKPEYYIESFDPSEVKFDIYCPVCHKAIASDVEATNDSRTGFADAKFSITGAECGCPFSCALTHDELRKRQLFADVHSELVLSGVYKYHSQVLIPRSSSNLEDCDRQLKAAIQTKWGPKVTQMDLNTILRYVNPEFRNRKWAKTLRLYPQMNLVSATVPNAILVWEDLVGAIIRHERFSEKLIQLDWLGSPLIHAATSESIIRYSRFFNLLTTAKQSLVPTLDIDLVWHTHQLSHYHYFLDCLKSANGQGSVVDHDDKVEQGRIDMLYQETCKMYKTRYKEEYSICFCRYCIATRSLTSSNRLALIFKSSPHTPPGNVRLDHDRWRNHPLYSSRLGVTHVSTHSAIEFPSAVAVKRRAKLEKRYGKDVPWREEGKTYYYAHLGHLFVLAPLRPVSSRCVYMYGNGPCVTADDDEVTMSPYTRSESDALRPVRSGTQSPYWDWQDGEIVLRKN